MKFLRSISKKNSFTKKNEKNVPNHAPTISVTFSLTGNTNRSVTSSGGVARLQNDTNIMK